MAKPKLWSGSRFSRLAKKLAGRKGVRNAKGLAAAIGRKKYGKSRFQREAAKARKG